MAEKITEKQILELKEQASDIRDQIISAKSTMQSVEKNIKNYKKELKDLGVEEGKAEEAIEEMRQEIEKIYSNSLATIREWKEKIG